MFLTTTIATYKVFLPALVFTATLETVKNGLSHNGSALQDIWVPLAAAILIFLLTAAIAHPLTLLFAKRKEEAVRRVMWSCIVLGNSNTMALLVMQSLCDSFAPLNHDPKCVVRSTGFASLYITVVTLFTVSSGNQRILFLLTLSVSLSSCRTFSDVITHTRMRIEVDHNI